MKNYFLLITYFCFIILLFSCSSTDDILSVDQLSENNEAVYPELKYDSDSSVKFPINFSYNGNSYTDLALAMIPKSYDYKKKTKLVIYCHSGGGFVNNTTSEAETQHYTRFFVSLGYIVIDVNGIPDSIVNSLKIDVGRTVGNPLTVTEYVTGFNEAIKKFNVDKDHVYIFSNSNGGAVASNIVNLTGVKVRAQSGICPLLAIKDNAWFIPSGKAAMGEFGAYQNRSNIIRLYGMQDAQTQIELNNATYDISKVGIYDPFEFLKNNNLDYKTKYKIFQPKDDPLVSYTLSQQFATNGNKTQTNIVIRSFETGGHNPEPQAGQKGIYYHNNISYPLTPTVYEVAKWFEENDGYLVKYF